MLISFVVPVHNTAPYIADCIGSILGQEGGFDFEIIMVDDASTDDSEFVARSFADSRITYIRHVNNQGASATISEGLALAKGTYVARIDSDDRYRPWFLSRTVPILESNPTVGLVYGDIRTMDISGAITCERLVSAHGGKPHTGDELDSLLETYNIPAPTVIARREAWQAALPIPSAYSFNDWYLSLEIAKRWQLHYTGEVLADYRIHTQNMHRTMVNDKKGEEITFDILEKYFQAPLRPHHDRAFKSRIFGTQYFTLGNKYFGQEHYPDARRCYLRALRHAPRQYFRAEILWRLAGTWLGPEGYRRIKRLVKSALRPTWPA